MPACTSCNAGTFLTSFEARKGMCNFLAKHIMPCMHVQATHNIMAYRIWSEERQLFDQDCDDDGESAAGGRLLHLLEIMNVRHSCSSGRTGCRHPCCSM